MAVRGSLRDELNTATRAMHDVLDARLSPLAMDADFGRFLQIQHAVRLPVETWMGQVSTELEEDCLALPLQACLIERDLLDLGLVPLEVEPVFDSRDPREAWGVAWALAGSSLGNRAILQRRRRAGCKLTHHFLADPAMPAFWSAFRRQIERPLHADLHRHAIVGAQRVFGSFLAQVDDDRGRLAA